MHQFFIRRTKLPEHAASVCRRVVARYRGAFYNANLPEGPQCWFSIPHLGHPFDRDTEAAVLREVEQELGESLESIAQREIVRRESGGKLPEAFVEEEKRLRAEAHRDREREWEEQRLRSKALRREMPWAFGD